MTTIKNFDALWAKALSCKVVKKSAGKYQVTSPSKVIYDVEIHGRYVCQCNCAHSLYTSGKAGCCHAMAAGAERAKELGFRVIWVVPQGTDWKAEGADGIFNLGKGAGLLVTKKKGALLAHE